MKRKSNSGFDHLLGGLFIALALAFPVIFHVVGLGGSFLPMFFPIATAGFLLPLPSAVAVGVLSPLFSALLTGMPPFYPPIAFIMMAEGAVLGAVPAILYRRLKLNAWLTISLAMAADRLVLLVSVLMLSRLFELPEGVLTAAALIKGIPGTIAIILVVPPLAKKMEAKIRFTRTIE